MMLVPLLVLDDEIALFCPGHTHHSSIKKLLSEHASRGVTKCLVSGHLTSERPSGSENPGSITLVSSEASKYGASMLITSPDLKTFTGLLIEDIYFCIVLRQLAHI